LSATVSAPTYDFDGETQTEILACLMWDSDFLNRSADLVRPEYFESDVERGFVRLALDHQAKYREAPSVVVWAELVKEAFKAKPPLWRDDLKLDVVAKIKETHAKVVRSRAWLLDRIGEFAKQQEITNALIESASVLNKVSDEERFAKIEARMTTAFNVGVAPAEDDYDFFDRIGERTTERLNIAAGGSPKTGITTGIKELDDLLKHRGWGRKEMSLLMGGAKSTKSFNLTSFAGAAVLAGYNTLLITLENSKEVQSDRLDAYFSDIGMSDQISMPHGVEGAITALATGGKIGTLRIREYPTGTFRPKDLERLIDEYKTKGVVFDIVVIDYMDIMAPDRKRDSEREESKEIYTRSRGIAVVENFALVSATQTNREGNKAATATATHVAEDFNRVKLADLVISVNRTEEEKKAHKARLYIALARNSEDGITIFVKQDLNKGKAVAEVESVE
jgi:replicative DNA helicase